MGYDRLANRAGVARSSHRMRRTEASRHLPLASGKNIQGTDRRFIGLCLYRWIDGMAVMAAGFCFDSVRNVFSLAFWIKEMCGWAK